MISKFNSKVMVFYIDEFHIHAVCVLDYSKYSLCDLPKTIKNSRYQ